MADIQIPRIASLPGSLINQIAAGEVIERPASVVKELIENAIDAGATRIDIEVTGGGTEKIVIRDNGCGIHPDDMELAILRHSTSKLKSPEDLLGINSLGFRGEALSSITSVSEFTLSSRVEGGDHGVELHFDPYTSRSTIRPCNRQTGTTVEVFRLFQPVPARRKFLRSNKTEYLHILDTVKRVVLGRLDVHISLRHNGKTIINCPATDTDCRDRVTSVLGKVFYENAWQIDRQAGDLRVWGWLGKEKAARSQSDHQFLYINRRAIKDRHISHAIRKAMDGVIHESRYPAYILHLFLDHRGVDVNVHPTKQEVRFRTPRDIHDFVYAALHETVNGGQAGLTEDNETVDPSAYPHRGGMHNRHASMRDLHALYAPDNGEVAGQVERGPLGTPVAVLYDTYVITRDRDSCRLIDMNALAKRYIREGLRERHPDGVKTRPLLVPVTVKFTPGDIEPLLARLDDLADLGMEITEAGPGSVSVRSIPSILPDLDIRQFINRMISRLRERKGKDAMQKDAIIDELVATGTSGERSWRSITAAGEFLRKLAGLDLPFYEKHWPPYWTDISRADLDGMLGPGRR